MFTKESVESFKMMGEMQADMIPGGIIYLVSDCNAFIWKAASKVFDLDIFNVGTKINPQGVIYRAIREKRNLIEKVPRSLYGIRLLINAAPVVDENGVVIGGTAIVVPVLHPVANAFDKFAPIISDMYPEGAFLYMSDLTKIAYRQSSKKFDMPGIQVGNILKEGDVAYEVIKTGKPVVIEYDASKHGVPTLFSNYPLYDDQNNIVATLGLILPKTSAFHLREMSSGIDVALEGISATIQELNASSSQIHENEKKLNNDIKDILHYSEEINTISNFIKEIADQTNLLGLNAAIEAARAGELGKGFGVVSQEIRKLSELSKSTVPRINELTNHIKQKVAEAGQKSEVSLVSSEEQAAATEEINASIEEITAQASELNRIARNI